jgi:hypothetical protein
MEKEPLGKLLHHEPHPGGELGQVAANLLQGAGGEQPVLHLPRLHPAGNQGGFLSQGVGQQK